MSTHQRQPEFKGVIEMYQIVRRDGIRCSFDTQKIIDALRVAAKHIKKANSLAMLEYYYEVLGEVDETEYFEFLEFLESLESEYVTKAAVPKLRRRLLRKIYKRVGDFLNVLWSKRIRTASRSNANATDKMLLTIPTPPTDDYKRSYQWGGGVLGCLG